MPGISSIDPSNGPPLQRSMLLKNWMFNELMEECDNSLFDEYMAEDEEESVSEVSQEPSKQS